MSNLTAEDKNIQAPAVMGIGSANGFGRMQGRLKKPVAGVPTGLFGKNRNGGDVWKGVFYSTAPATVESIAAGTVSYADELDGYGKVVVVDHGENYISIYAGLSEISVSKGYTVAAGSKIGTSGLLPDGEEGLYLQIRYEGQVLNPSSWIR
ncbi:peptidase, M23 family [Neisseria polysaccharea ATCC 43768]|nr:peptidase, M23 family [Neisseria polysaccharea ATCC 43768]